MHICFLSSEYPKVGHTHGGVGTFLQILARNLVKKNIQVSIIGLNYSDESEITEDQGVKVYRLKPRRFKPFTWYLTFDSINIKLKEIHQNEPISIVESTELGLAFIQKIAGVKYVIRMNGGHHFFRNRKTEKLILGRGIKKKGHSR